MALPKRRHSVTRGRKRRSHNALKAPGTTVCPRCDEVKEPHTICAKCGHYAGREVIEMEKA